jgi:hypothetical protein
MKNIICFLTVKPTKEFYDFSKSLKNNEYDVYIIVDDNEYKIPNYDGVVPVIQINNKICEKKGFKNTLYYVKDKACARDKAMYYFTEMRIQFKYLWLIEEDVFIPDVSIIKNIDIKYPNFDLLCKSNKILKHIKETNEWHWPTTKANIYLPFPWSCSLICAVRISPKLLGCISNYAKLYNTLFLDEGLFNTIAIHNRLSIGNIEELSKLEFNRIWKLEEISNKYLYHPIKNFKDHIYLRQYISTNTNLDTPFVRRLKTFGTAEPELAANPEGLALHGNSVLIENSNANIDNKNIQFGNYENVYNTAVNNTIVDNTSKKTDIKQLEIRLAKAISLREETESEIETLKYQLLNYSV